MNDMDKEKQRKVFGRGVLGGFVTGIGFGMILVGVSVLLGSAIGSREGGITLVIVSLVWMAAGLTYLVYHSRRLSK